MVNIIWVEVIFHFYNNFVTNVIYLEPSRNNLNNYIVQTNINNIGIVV